jgi:hypothetical protein
MTIRSLALLGAILCVGTFPLHSAEPPAKSGNPVFPGWYADPEAVVFGGKFWVYPTYSAPYGEQVFFDAFSSTDLVTWTKHSRDVDIDRAREDVRQSSTIGDTYRERSLLMCLGLATLQQQGANAHPFFDMDNRDTAALEIALEVKASEKAHERTQCVVKLILADGILKVVAASRRNVIIFARCCETQQPRPSTQPDTLSFTAN